jgi:CRP/FNR family cyclic AMP-dependent transcriptional regulator
MAMNPTHNGVCQLLLEDADLAEAIPSTRRQQAVDELVVDCLRVPTGPWTVPDPGHPDAIGLVVLEGLLIRTIDIDGRFGVELLGEGDVLRPWQGSDAPTLTLAAEWSALSPARLAWLDGRFATHFARYPAIASRLFERALRRSRCLATNMAIVHQPRVDTRLHLLFWHLAGRWGRVRRDGVLLPLKLTHTVLADLVAARRPTVTSALSDLTRRGLVRSVEDGWLLSGPAPPSLTSSGSSFESHEEALLAAGAVRT